MPKPRRFGSFDVWMTMCFWFSPSLIVLNQWPDRLELFDLFMNQSIGGYTRSHFVHISILSIIDEMPHWHSEWIPMHTVYIPTKKSTLWLWNISSVQFSCCCYISNFTHAWRTAIPICRPKNNSSLICKRISTRI